MRNNCLSIVAALVLGGISLAQTTAPSATGNPDAANGAPSAAEFGSSAIWRPAANFLTAVHTACDSIPYRVVSPECFINQMEKAGASKDALKFTRELLKSNGQVGIMEEYKDFSPLGLAWIVYPLRENDNDGLLVLNGDPELLDPDDTQKLDKAALAHDPLFVEWKKALPNLGPWPGDRSGGDAQFRFAHIWPGIKPGEQRFLFSYPLVDGCKICTRSGFASYWWEFDVNGKFQGTRLLSVTRGVPPIKRRLPPPVGAATPPGTRP